MEKMVDGVPVKLSVVKRPDGYWSRVHMEGYETGDEMGPFGTEQEARHYSLQVIELICAWGAKVIPLDLQPREGWDANGSPVGTEVGK